MEAGKISAPRERDLPIPSLQLSSSSLYLTSNQAFVCSLSTSDAAWIKARSYRDVKLGES